MNKSLDGKEVKLCFDEKEHEIRTVLFVSTVLNSLVKLGWKLPDTTDVFEFGLFFRCMDMQSFWTSFGSLKWNAWFILRV